LETHLDLCKKQLIIFAVHLDVIIVFSLGNESVFFVKRNAAL